MRIVLVHYQGKQFCHLVSPPFSKDKMVKVFHSLALVGTMTVMSVFEETVVRNANVHANIIFVS